MKVNADGSLVWRHDLSVRDAILRELRFNDRWQATAETTTVPITYLRCGRTHVGSYETTAGVLRYFPDCELIDLPEVEHNLPSKHPEILVSIVSRLLTASDSRTDRSVPRCRDEDRQAFHQSGSGSRRPVRQESWPADQ